MLVCAVVCAVGCGKKERSRDEVEAQRAHDKVEAQRARVEERLVDALPSGARVMPWAESDEVEPGYSVEWSHPDFNHRYVTFAVEKTGPTVKIVCPKMGEWVYESGELRSEKLLGADGKQWEWLKVRVDEIAKATYKVAG